ncbi:MAG: glutamyl-tRNA reductase [Acidimicrobiia bacterium]|nr:glutamyl-tRNA reductase [Acidimicrobiia bacterium]
MSVVVIGLNHRTASLDLLERMTVDGARLPKALQDLASRTHLSEAVVLSTCNRTEVYAVAERFHGGFQDIRDFLGELAFLAPEDFADHLYVRSDDDAVTHLFEVAAGLDSAVLGESEILGQVGAAWDAARVEGVAGPTLNLLFRHALEAGKRARTDTGIARGITSVSQAAVALAAHRLGSLVGARVLVVGTGEMGEAMAVAIAEVGAFEVLVANRTSSVAEDLAARVGGRSVALGALSEHLSGIDLLLTSTGAQSLILEHADLERVTAGRAGRPLLIIDVAVPRDVDPSAAALPGVELLDMDDLRRFVDEGAAGRRREAEKARVLVEEHVRRYAGEATAREVAPLVAALRERAESIRLAETERVDAKLAGLDPRQREAVEAATRAIVAKLLHEPTVRLKGAAGTSRGDRLAESLRDLFDL